MVISGHGNGLQHDLSAVRKNPPCRGILSVRYRGPGFRTLQSVPAFNFAACCPARRPAKMQSEIEVPLAK